MKHPELTLCEFPETGIPGVETMSPFVLKVRRALAVAGLSYDSWRVDHPAKLKQVNPAGQAPVLLVDSVPVADSTRILAKIEELVPGRLSRDADPRVRAEALLWEEFADVSLSGFLVASRWADDDNWPRTRDVIFGKAPWFVRALIAPRVRARVVGSLVARDVWRAGPDACWTRFGLVLDQLETRAPESGYWVGRALSVADLAIFAMLHSLRNAITPWQRDEIAKRKKLSSYLDRIDAETTTKRLGAAAEASGVSPGTPAAVRTRKDRAPMQPAN
jgi:glutathione S-transferase